MRVLVFEFLTGGGIPASQGIPASLAREGGLMLQTLAEDLADIPGVEVVTTRDTRLPPYSVRAVQVGVKGAEEAWPAWRSLLHEVDAAWPIAPETGGVLERISRLVQTAECRLLNSPPQAVAITASKTATAAHFACAGVSVAPAWAAMHEPAGHGPWVAKPDDGAGSEQTMLLENRAGWRRWVTAADRTGFVLQPYLPGVAGSLSVLCRAGRSWLLAANRQYVDIVEGRFVYRGGIVAGLAETPRHHGLAAEVAAALPDLWGHVGIDFVETPDGPVLIEVNPRLTTSYVGLRRATGLNAAALALQLLAGPLGAFERIIFPCNIVLDAEETA